MPPMKRKKDEKDTSRKRIRMSNKEARTIQVQPVSDTPAGPSHSQNGRSFLETMFFVWLLMGRPTAARTSLLDAIDVEGLVQVKRNS